MKKLLRVPWLVATLALTLGHGSADAAAASSPFNPGTQAVGSAGQETPDTLPTALVEARLALDSVHALADTVRELIVRFDTSSAADRQVMRVRGAEPLAAITTLLERTATLVSGQPDSAAAVEELRQALLAEATWSWEVLTRFVQENRQGLSEANERRLTLPRAERGPVHAEGRDLNDRLDRLLEYQLRTLVLADSARLAFGTRADDFDAILLDRAPNLVGQIQLALDDQTQARQELRQAGRAGVGGDALAAATLTADETQNWTLILAEALASTVDLLDQRGRETTRYRQLIIQATGAVSDDILDFDVLWGLAADFVASSLTWLRANAGNLVIRFLTIVATTLLFRFGFRSLWALSVLGGVGKTSRATRALGSRIFGPLGTITGFLVGLYLVGVAPTFLLAGMGVASVILGLALQDSVSNLAAGAFILLHQPFDLEHNVRAGGVVGTVKVMGLASTTVLTYDHRLVLIPNRKIWADEIENHTVTKTRRAEAKVSVAYEDDLDRVRSALAEMLSGMDGVLEKPEPEIFVSELGDSGVEFTVRCWAATDDWWKLQSRLPGDIWSWCRKNDIEIPYPRRQMIVPNQVAGQRERNVPGAQPAD